MPATRLQDGVGNVVTPLGTDYDFSEFYRRFALRDVMSRRTFVLSLARGERLDIAAGSSVAVIDDFFPDDSRVVLFGKGGSIVGPATVAVLEGGMSRRFGARITALVFGLLFLALSALPSGAPFSALLALLGASCLIFAAFASPAVPAPSPPSRSIWRSLRPKRFGTDTHLPERKTP